MNAIKNSIFAFTLSLSLWAGPEARPAPRQFAAPPGPPSFVHSATPTSEARFQATATTTYSIGDPTPEEQLYVEMINRARTNPTAEAALFATTTDPDVVGNLTFFNVDRALMQAQFATNPVAPPVAPNGQLAVAARRHSADMLAHSFQEHVGSDDSTFVQRITDAGYNYSTIGENVYANAHSVLEGHASFEVDWGFGPGGMQPLLGHRRTIHDRRFREVGVGVAFGSNVPAPGSVGDHYRPVGPQLVSQEFGTRQGATPLITGVVYFDLNGNNFYDLGEGIGGVRVTASGTATEGVTARSGGYAVPVAGNGAYTLTFSGEGLAPIQRTVTVTGNENLKIDLLPTYVPPAITGSLAPAINTENNYQFSAVAAANAYQWRSRHLITPAVEGAENGTNKVTVNKTGTYPVLEAGTKKSGSFSFHLAHPQGGIVEQSILLQPGYIARANTVLRFESRLGAATQGQTALVQVSTNNGASWRSVYNQVGTGGAGEANFQLRSVNLSEFAGLEIRFRFAYVPAGSVFINTDATSGWFIDDITLENASELSSEQIHDSSNASFAFRPTGIGDFALQARARTGHNFLPWGPALTVRSVEGTATPTEIRVSAIRAANGQVELDISLLAGAAPGALILQTKATLAASRWLNVSATTQTLSPTSFRLSAPISPGGSGFFRVQAN